MTAEPQAPGVLLVQHDPDTQSALVKVLARSGATVVGTGSAEGALALFSSWPTGVVVVDDELPGMGGLEVVRRLHAASPAARILFMSRTPDSAETNLAARLAGAFATLAKPVGVTLLVELVTALVAQSA